MVDGSEIEVGFPEEGRVSASAGCNGMGAPVTLDHGRITLVEDLERTLMLCEPQELMDQEAWLAGFLQSGPSYALEGARLTLETGEARMELVAASTGRDTTGRPPDGVDTGAGDAAEAPSGKTELPGTTWQVTGIVDGNTTTSVPEGVVATITFEDDGRAITVETCNGGGGDVDISETRMTFAPVAMTRRLCPGEQGTAEAVMLGVLRGEVSYRLDGDTLVLRHPDDKALTLRPA